MNNINTSILLLVTLLSLAGPAGSKGMLCAQDEAPKFEAGVQVTTLRLNALGKSVVGIGGRFGYQLTPHIGLEAEAAHFPQGPVIHDTRVLAGLRVGQRFEDWGVYARLRPGALHFVGTYFGQQLDLRRTQFALDVGAGVERFFNPRVSFRMDLGDTIIPFGGALYHSAFGPVRLGTTHSFEASFGLSFHF